MTTEEAIRAILKNIGEDPDREGLLETPKRVAKAHAELFSGYNVDPSTLLKTFTNEDYDEMIVVKDIEYYSNCEHHMLPFFGKAHVAYIPDKKITGLSKLPRLVEVFARRLQNQERLTVQVAQTLMDSLAPIGVAVQISGLHMCMCSRGAGQSKSETISTCFRGKFKDDPNLRSDFFNQIKTG
jgi:GTP cyclohydrolase I